MLRRKGWTGLALVALGVVVVLMALEAFQRWPVGEWGQDNKARRGGSAVAPPVLFGAELIESPPVPSCPLAQTCMAFSRILSERRMSTYGRFTEDPWLFRAGRAPDGVATLVGMLSADDATAEWASLALREAGPIDPVHLPDILAGIDRGLGWLPSVLGQIRSDEAARLAVERFIGSESAPNNQEGFAVIQQGARAVPFLLKAIDCRQRCSEAHSDIVSVFKRMGPERRIAARPLMAMAEDERVPKATAHAALLAIAALGTDGRSVEARLERLAQERQESAPVIEEAIIGIKGARSGRILAERLGQPRSGFPAMLGDALADGLIIREIAALGPAGRSAGPELVEMLTVEDPDLRLEASLALGHVGYPDPDALIPLLDDEDARLAWAAARSLARLSATKSLPALHRTAELHWYEPVRAMARRAIHAIESGVPFGNEGRDGMYRDLWKATHFGLEACAYGPEKEPRESGRKSAYAGDDMSAFAYATQVIGFGAADAEEQAAAGKDIIEVHPGNMVRHVNDVEQTPHVALEVEDGWLLGGDRGEFGGELMFRDRAGNTSLLADMNVRGIHRLGDRIVITSGLSHMGLNHGAVMEAVRDERGGWSVKRLRTLPGGGSSWRLDASRLMINARGGGTLVLDATGRLSMAACMQEGSSGTGGET